MAGMVRLGWVPTAHERPTACGAKGRRRTSTAAPWSTSHQPADRSGTHPLLRATRQAVAEPFRRQGVARALLRAAEAQAARWGFPPTALVLHVHADNAAARALYTSAGWEELDADATLPSLLLGRRQRVLMARSLQRGGGGGGGGRRVGAASQVDGER